MSMSSQLQTMTLQRDDGEFDTEYILQYVHCRFTVCTLYTLYLYVLGLLSMEYSAESALYHKLHLPVELIIHLPIIRQDPTDGTDGISIR